MTIYLIILFIVGLILYKIDKGLIPCYWLILQTLCLPIVVVLSGAMEDVDILNAYGQQNRIINILLLVLLILNSSFTIKDLYQFRFIIISIFILFLISFMWILYHNAINVDIYDEPRNFLMRLLLIVYMFVIRKTTAKQLVITFSIITVIELIIALLNHYCGIHAYIFQYYIPSVEFTDVYTSGTFKRFNILGCYLCIIQSILSVEYLLKKKSNMRFFNISTIIIGYVIFLTGSRISLIVFILSLIIPIVINFKQHRFYIVFFSILFITLIQVTFSLSSSSLTDQGGTGIQRNLVGLNYKFKNKNTHNKTTDNLSSFLISTYATLDPFGQGKTANQNTESAYHDPMYAIDSRFAYIFVERGWLYFLVFLSYFYFVFKYVINNVAPINRRGIIITFVNLIILSITDDGIYDPLLFMVFISYGYMCIKKTKKHANEKNFIQ